MEETARPAAVRNRRDRLGHRLAVVPALLLVAGAAIVPLCLLLFSSLVDQRTGSPTIGYYRQALANPFFLRTLATTMLMGLGVTLLSLVLALPMAYVLARRTMLRTVVLPVISILRMLPVVVVGYGIILLLAPYTGVVNKFLVTAGLVDRPAFILFDWPGQALTFLYSGIVVAITILTGVLMTVDPQMEDAAVSLGAGRLRAVLTVTLPLCMPGVIAASALIFSMVVTAYSVPVMLNSRTPYMVSVVIYNNFYTLQERHLAYAQAIIVTVLSLGVTAVAQVFLSRFGRR